MDKFEYQDPTLTTVVPQKPIDQVNQDEVAKKERSRLSSIFTVIFSGFALLSDGYQVGVLSLVNVCFTKIYGDEFTSAISTRIGNSLFIGCIIGQIGFGYICDRVGRKVGLLLTTFLVILGAALCAGAYGAGGSVEGLFWALTVYRGILGVGVGGEYPCSSASASEAADEVLPGRRGMLFVFVTNFVIDCGFVLSALFPLILGAAGCSYPVIWRASFAFGVLPPLSVMYFRFKMDNSQIFQKNSMKKNVPYLLIFRRYWKYLLGTGGSWFFYNFISYPFGIFAGTILDNAIGADATFVQTAEWMLLLNCFYLPGSISGALASDKIGRKRTMALGFFCQGVLGIIMGVFYTKLLNVFPLFVVLYGIFMMMGEFGPGDMLGLVSAEIYPTAVRGTAYGWSAAFGKFGAFVGTSIFKPLISSFGHGDEILGQSRVFIFASCLALLGSVFTYILIPDYSKKALGEEDEDFRQYLASHNYDLSNFGENGFQEMRSAALDSDEKSRINT
ncbi:Plasma membrane permease, mediates uptake of glycerophosphoinositol and glycerophosphocholine [Lobosporangium transversale]|uniref:MFS Git1p-like glycerophosphoinositol permease n=1 Tax=Lobosporangium transversale TaxID=64571 RepID=A0A1Y2GFI9_9FUNG|nr:MFS Git1p-like glycerophosphoinositol permease [Lobosporangium transversale]KAF9918518.1 Plasma membrane permease, mediates uptake of glycerophosphoinositol and glycerophosphocholine [Lobosporangium transversale]ORZ09412.1 MFS Git1p-like glycerophosphoinositol permease [Lobosporangium transversale]|eukprot:XP_021878865.1 MFS Git1p-like glycerophosphoinositol permease [Lobosporangium transversale]